MKTINLLLFCGLYTLFGSFMTYRLCMSGGFNFIIIVIVIICFLNALEYAMKYRSYNYNKKKKRKIDGTG